jgi:hypothetical protein
MNAVCSFATGRFLKSQKLLASKSYEFGADNVFSYNQSDVDSDFIKKNYTILSQPKGAGLWLWKPYIILKTLEKLQENDNLLYCDSGLYPINNLNYLFDLTKNNDIILFQVHNHLNKNWTKKLCFSLMSCDEEKYFESEQICGTYQVYKKSEKSLNFVKTWLNFCENENIIADNKVIKQNEINSYVEHRWDQSILTNLGIQNNIEIYRDPSQWGNEHHRLNSKYPQIFNLHRGNII